MSARLQLRRRPARPSPGLRVAGIWVAGAAALVVVTLVAAFGGFRTAAAAPTALRFGAEVRSFPVVVTPTSVRLGATGDQLTVFAAVTNPTDVAIFPGLDFAGPNCLVCLPQLARPSALPISPELVSAGLLQPGITHTLPFTFAIERGSVRPGQQVTVDVIRFSPVDASNGGRSYVPDATNRVAATGQLVVSP